MIGKLKGAVDSIEAAAAVIDVGGVGYVVQCPARTLARLSAGQSVILWIETHVREDAIQLYGFLDTAEREWFRLLMTVQGVGARVGLAVLSVLGPAELMQAVASGDKGLIGKAPGVGPKLAGRIASELRDKVSAMALGAAAKDGGGAGGHGAPGAESGPVADAASALVNLGYGPAEALGAVVRAAGILGESAGTGALIKGGLKALGEERAR
ncbi:MAG: Holliday junction branch migration protein RuvA [Rhodospirillales bacterium]